MVNKFNALIVDPDIQARMRLKTATAAVGNFGLVAQHGELKQGLSALSAEPGTDVVFISTRFSRDEVTEFVKTARGVRNSQDCAYVLLLSQGKQEASLIACGVLEGLDGFLFEPYSAESLLEITRIAATVKSERSRVREQVALRLLLREAMAQIDLVAQLRKAGSGAAISARALQETCGVLRTLEADSLATYFEVALEEFEKVSPPKSTKSDKIYTGASKRARAIAEERLVAEIKAEAQRSRAASGGE